MYTIQFMFVFPGENQAGEAVDTAIKAILMNIERLQTTSHTEKKLSAFSPNLCRFQWFGGDNYLELPGQYPGDQMPMVSNHTKIFKINPRVQVYRTLRFPIRITIHGSDGKEYKYLVKYGEDLRQDERIQQLLGVMSRQLSADKSCRDHQMSLRTYQVIPLKTYCGMLAFVEDAKSINELVVETYSRIDDNSDEALLNIKRKHLDFLRHSARHLTAAEQKPDILYGESAMKYSMEEVSSDFAWLPL